MSASETTEYLPNTSLDKMLTNPLRYRARYNTAQPMPNLALKCDRYNISSWKAAALISAAFRDYKIIENKTGEPLIIDRSKIDRERAKNRSKILAQSQDFSLLKVFSFDSKKDETQFMVKIDSKRHLRREKENYVIVLKDPNSVYVGSAVTENNSTARQIKDILVQFFINKNTALDDLIGIFFWWRK